MKAALDWTDTTVIMDCTPEELAGLISLLRDCPREETSETYNRADETPAPADTVLEPEPQEPEPEPVDTVQEPETETQETAQEAEPVIPPEPAQRETLGEALVRLRKEEQMRKRMQDDGRHYKYRPVYAKNDNGDVIYCDSVAEMAIKLGVTPQCVNQAMRKGQRCKGYKIKEDDPKTIL